jgi:hypothetical protein
MPGGAWVVGLQVPGDDSGRDIMLSCLPGDLCPGTYLIAPHPPWLLGLGAQPMADSAGSAQ